MLFVCALISSIISRMDIHNFISMSIVSVYIIPIILYFLTNNSLHIFALIGSITTTFISELLKYTVFKEISVRPVGARDCNYLCNDGNQAGQPGMPSSHSAEVAFFCGFYLFYTKTPLIRIILILYAIAIMYSRYIKRCHTIYQIVAGVVLGLILTASFIVLKKELIWKDK